MTENLSQGARMRAERARQRAARKQRIVISVSVLVLLVLCLASARPIYRALKARRSDHLASEAETLVRAGKLNEAASKYRAALQLDPLGYHALSGAARLATRGGRPEATDLWQEVIRSSAATSADRQQYAALLLQRGATRTAETLIEQLLKTAPDAKTLALASHYSSATANPAKALEFARLAVARAPEDDGLRFELAELLAKSSETAQREEARQILWLLAGKKGRTRQAALEALARAPELPREEEERVLAALSELPPRATTSLLAAELKLKLQPGASGQVFEDAVRQWSNAAETDLVELVRWLNLHKQSERVLALLPEERAIASEPLLLSRLDALASLERWKEIDAILARPNLALDLSVIESFRARNAMSQGVNLDADLHWDRALTLASGDPTKLRFVATFAEQTHATATALKGYDQLARFPEQAAFAQRSKARLMENAGDAPAARSVAERLTAVAPDDINAQAQLAHLNLLLNTDVAANLAKAKELIAKDPTRLSFRVTAALGYLRLHDAAGALQVFSGPPIEWEKTPPSWRAIYAAVLAMNDQTDAARTLVATIPQERLNKEERELIAPIAAP